VVGPSDDAMSCRAGDASAPTLYVLPDKPTIIKL
jgi:hypothetical protein